MSWKNKKLSITPLSLDLLLLLNYLLIFSVRWFTDISFGLLSILWAFMGFIIFFYCFIHYVDYIEVVFISLIIILTAILSQFISRSNSLFTPISLLATISVGILLYIQRTNLRYISNFCILIILYLTARCGLLIKSVGILVAGAVKLSKLTGQNTVSIIIFFCLSIYIIEKLQSNKKISIVPFIISLVCCLFCEGTGGILVGFCFLIGLFLKQNGKNRLSYIKLSLIIVLAILFIIKKSSTATEIGTTVTDDNSRFWIWSNYYRLATSSLKNMIFGAPLDSIPFLYRLQNLHNTFINFHYMYGLIPMIFFVIMIIRIGWYYFKTKNYLMLLVYACIGLRAFTDESSFVYMTLWIYMWLDSLYGKGHYKRIMFKQYLFKYNSYSEENNK